MNATHHFEEAEWYLSKSKDEGDPTTARLFVQIASVHAQLAVAAKLFQPVVVKKG